MLSVPGDVDRHFADKPNQLTGDGIRYDYLGINSVDLLSLAD